MDDQQRQHILDPAKIAAGGVAAPLGALLTSRFGVAGTMLGLALSAVVVTTLSDILKAYLQRAPGAVKNISPVSFKQPRFSWKNFRSRIAAPFSWFLSLAPSRKRAMLLSGLLAGVVAFLIGTGVVTALEVGVGNNLSCWVWNECSTDSSTAKQASTTSTLPSILGGGQGAVSSSNTAQEGQQPSSQPSGTPTAKAPSSSPSGQQQQTPSGAPEEQQQSSPPTQVVEQQEQQEQQSSSSPTGEQQSSSSSTKVTEDQQQSPPSVPDSGVGTP